MSASLFAQLRAVYVTCRRKLNLPAAQAYSIACASVRLPARRAHYVAACRSVTA